MLSRRSLRVVLQSLIAAELRAARGRAGPDARPAAPLPATLPATWPDSLAIGGGAPDGLGCDSLEALWLGAAVNEMFHLHEAGDEAGLLGEPTFGGWIDRVEAAWRSGVAALTVTTSGTTGRPKRCIHAAEALLTEAAVLRGVFAGRTRIVSLVPAHHAYGLLFAAFLPDALGVALLDATALGPSEIARGLAPGDLVVTFPERWQWLERSLPAWPADVEGAVSTAPCPPDLIAALRERGLAGMTEVYGASETAGIALRHWPDAAYELMPQWRFADATDDAAPEILHRSGRHVALPDRIRRLADRRFLLAERLDGAVQVGGVNVHPAHVAERLRARPGVRDAAVRLMRPEEGQRLKAFVVPDPAVDAAALRQALEDWIRAALPAAERPTALAFGPCLPANPMGKPRDW